MASSRALALVALGILLVTVVSATVPNDWLSNGFHVPPCSAQTNVKHFEVAVSSADSSGLVAAYDTLRVRGYSNLQYRFLSNGEGVWSGDCSIAT